MSLALVVQRFERAIGLDFYNYWGVPLAWADSAGALGSPYLQSPAYAVHIAQIASQPDDPRGQAVAAARQALDLTGTPPSYVIWGILPARFSTAFAIFQGVQLAALLAASCGIARLCGRRVTEGAVMAALLLITFEPARSDLRVGNVNLLQLGSLVGLVLLASRPLQTAGAVFAGAGVLVLLKPTVLLPGIALALSVAVSVPWRIATRGALIASGALASLAIWPGLVLRQPTLWSDWYHTVVAARQSVLVLPVAKGNYATAQLLSETIGGSADSFVPALLVGLVVTWGGALALGAWRSGGWSAALLRVGRDPALMACLGIVVSLAASPLTWTHYYTLGLFPALWLLWQDGSNGRGWILAALALIVLTAPLMLVAMGAPSGLRPWLFTLAWALLWAGLLGRVAARVAAPMASTHACL